MKNKKIVLTTSLVAVLALAYMTKKYRDEQRDIKIGQIIKEVRLFFASFGDIATVYINQVTSNKVETKGGVIMADGRIYQFDYLAGEIFYQEE